MGLTYDRFRVADFIGDASQVRDTCAQLCNLLSRTDISLGRPTRSAQQHAPAPILHYRQTQISDELGTHTIFLMRPSILIRCPAANARGSLVDGHVSSRMRVCTADLALETRTPMWRPRFYASDEAISVRIMSICCSMSRSSHVSREIACAVPSSGPSTARHINAALCSWKTWRICIAAQSFRR